MIAWVSMSLFIRLPHSIGQTEFDKIAVSLHWVYFTNRCNVVYIHNMSGSKW